MSEKMSCPGCGSHSSGVLRAYEADQPCPTCGLGADATGAVLAARRSTADAALRTKYEELRLDFDHVERERDAFRARLDAVNEAMDGWKP